MFALQRMHACALIGPSCFLTHKSSTARGNALQAISIRVIHHEESIDFQNILAAPASILDER
jgi:hypothetical protein